MDMRNGQLKPNTPQKTRTNTHIEPSWPSCKRPECTELARKSLILQRNDYLPEDIIPTLHLFYYVITSLRCKFFFLPFIDLLKGTYFLDLVEFWFQVRIFTASHIRYVFILYVVVTFSTLTLTYLSFCVLLQ